MITPDITGSGALNVSEWTRWQPLTDAGLERVSGKVRQHNPGAGVGAGNAAYVGATFGDNQTVTADFDSIANYGALLLNVSTPGASYNGYVAFWGSGSTAITIQKVTGGVGSNLNVVNALPTASVKFERIGNTLKCYFDGSGTAAITATDSGTPWTGGTPGVGISDSGSVIQISNIVLTGEVTGGSSSVSPSVSPSASVSPSPSRSVSPSASVSPSSSVSRSASPSVSPSASVSPSSSVSASPSPSPGAGGSTVFRSPVIAATDGRRW
jgi:hypothetical protein